MVLTKYIHVILLLVIAYGCGHQVASDDLTIDSRAISLDRERGIALYKSIPFTGKSVSYYTQDVMAESIEYVEGKKDGFHRKWFEDATISYECKYSNGQKVGESKSWWRNGKVRSKSQFVNGVAHGLQEQWYQSGARFKHLRYNNGKVEGMQQSWRQNGKIYNNYEAKNGRIFGLKRASLCFSLDNEEIQYESN